MEELPLPASVVRTVGEMRQVIAAALVEILTDDELAATVLRVLQRPADQSMMTLEQWPERCESDLLDEETLLDFHVFDAHGGSWMQGSGTAAEMYARFRSELQDFVATSSFAWGQWRP